MSVTSDKVKSKLIIKNLNLFTMTCVIQTILNEQLILSVEFNRKQQFYVLRYVFMLNFQYLRVLCIAIMVIWSMKELCISINIRFLKAQSSWSTLTLNKVRNSKTQLS